MRTFQAIVFNPSGQEEIVKIKATTEEEVRHHLHGQGFTIKKVEEARKTGIWAKLNEMEVGARIKPENRVRLLRTLGQMIERGYVLENVIDFLLADEKEKDVVKLLHILQRKAGKGYKDYVELFKEAEDYFDREFFSILVAGQKTGTVGKNLIDYAAGKKKMLEQKGALRNILMGRFIILAVVLVAFVVIVTVIVPQFQKLFGDKLELPIGMKILIWISVVLENYGVTVAVSVILAVLLVVALYQFHQKIKFFFQHVLLNTPVLGPLLRMMYTRDFLYMMGNLISKGVALMEAMRITIEQTTNLCFRSVYESIEVNLEKGRKLEQVLRPLDPQLIAAGLYVSVPTGYLLDSVSQAMTLGAKGGNLGEMLNEAYQTYDFQLQTRIALSIKIIGGMISIFTYVLIMFMIGSLALTLFKVMENPAALA